MQEDVRESGAISSERLLLQPGRRSLLISLMVYCLLAPLVFAFATFCMGVVVMTAQGGFPYPVEGKSFFSAAWHSLMLFKNPMVWFFTGPTGDGGIGPPMVVFVYALGLVPSAIFGFLHHFFAGRIIRLWRMLLIMVILSCIFLTVLVFIFGATGIGGPPFFVEKIGVYIRIIAFLWVPGVLTPLLCSSIAFLIQRRRNRKYIGKLADAV